MRCGSCGDEFETKRGLKTHIGIMHDPLPREKAKRMYAVEGLSVDEIAERVNLSVHSVCDRLTEYNLWKQKVMKFNLITPSGYPTISALGVTDIRTSFRIHRLIAIADGADPHDIFGGNYDVHHKNGVRWDNRPSNLEVIDHAEHASLHND